MSLSDPSVGTEMDAQADCPFCAIVTGHAQARVVTADDRCLAFLAATPAARGHTLVIPRRHVADLWDTDADLAAALMRTTHAVAALLRTRLRPEGLTLRQNTGPASGQHVAHLHVHLVPRWQGDGTIGWPRPPAAQPDPDAVLAELRGD